MEYIKGSAFRLDSTSVTLGKFDGIHLGHRKLIEEVKKSEGLKSVLFTFDLNPLNLFSEKEIKLIYTNEERKNLLLHSGLDFLIDYPFSKEMADMKPEIFIEEVIFKKLGAKKIIVGTDFRFGKDREGDIQLLEKRKKDYGYELLAIDKLMKDGMEISSTYARKLLKNGEIIFVNELLGRPYHILETVIHGRNLGHTIGMPTINQKPDKTKLLPPFGVYASITEIEGKKYKGITNIGVKPTIGESFTGVETWLFDFNKDVYGKTAKVCLYDFIRAEMKFSNLEELKNQVNLDVIKVKEVLSRYSMEVV